VWHSFLVHTLGVSLRPDQMIGCATFSFVEERLLHKPLGPRWINLYSSSYVSEGVSVCKRAWCARSGLLKSLPAPAGHANGKLHGLTHGHQQRGGA
jgi:hypothetical protein